MELLALDNVNFTYNGSFRLGDFSLTVNRGDFTGIIGPNGSGKSTIIKLMAGFLTPDSGSIRLEGHALAGLNRKAVAKKIAVVSQGVHTDFEFTVEEMVRLGRMPYLGRWQAEGPGDAAAVERALELTRLVDFRQRYYNRLSGGEAQRVLVAQALAQDPEILLLDEPTTYMDLAYQQDLFSLLTDLNQEGITVVAVLHDINLAALYCRDLVVIQGGRVFTQGNPAQVITRENIQAVFGCKVEVNRHSAVNRPQITLLPGQQWHNEDSALLSHG